jgi:putative DNA primase/helicase
VNPTWMTRAVSAVANATATETKYEKVEALLTAIRSGKWSAPIAAIRAAGTKDERKALKKRLPAVMWSGTFSERNTKALLEHSGILCADFDHVAERMEEARAKLEADSHVAAVWTSPSGDGLKCLLLIPADSALHKAAFRVVADYFAAMGLTADPARKDVAGMCFVSHDPVLFTRENPEPFAVLADVPEASSTDMSDEPAPATLCELRAALGNIKADCTYDDWIKVGQAIHSYDAGPAGLALWDGWSKTAPTKYEPDACAKRWPSFTAGGGVTVASLFQMAGEGAPILTRMSDIQRQPIRWLWKHRIAIGKLTIIAGDPGGGKSHVCVDIASRISTGKDWPDGGCAPAGDILIMQAEDDEGDTLRPRLEAAGADLNRIHVLKGRKLSGQDHPQAISLHNLATIDRALAGLPECRLLIVDPVSAYLGKTEANDTAEVRALLAPLQELCNRRSVGLVIVSHPNKSAGQKAMYRIGGALGFVAAARVAWLVAKDDDHPERRTFTCIKSNVGPTDIGLGFRLEAWPEEPDYWRVVWEEGVVSLSADDVMNPAEEDREVIRGLDRLLMQELAAGPVESERMSLTLRQAGYADRTVRRAKKRLGIISEKARGGLVGKWVWRLPSTEDGPRDHECTSSAMFCNSSKNTEGGRTSSKVAEGGQDVQCTEGVLVHGELRI